MCKQIYFVNMPTHPRLKYVQHKRTFPMSCYVHSVLATMGSVQAMMLTAAMEE
jgi:hypothetical protein